MWHVLDGDDNSTCITHEKNILQAGTQLHAGDNVTFFYNGKKCTGVIVFSDRDHAKCNAELNKHVKKKVVNKPRPVESSLPAKRNRNQTPFFGPDTSSASVPLKKKKNEGPPMTEAEKTRQRILALNKKEAAKHANAALLSRIIPKPKPIDDDDWIPPEDEQSQDSVVDIRALKNTLKGDQSAIIDQLSRSHSPSPTNNQGGQSLSPSPTNNQGGQSLSPSPKNRDGSEGDRISVRADSGDDREKLLKEIEELKKKLSEKDKSALQLKPKETTLVEDKRNTENNGNTWGRKRFFEDGNTKGRKKLFEEDSDDFGAGKMYAQDGKKGGHEQDFEDDSGGNKKKGKDCKMGGDDEDNAGRESGKETGRGPNEGGDSKDPESEANSSFSQKDDLFVDELLGMDASGKVNMDQVRDETLEYQLYGKREDTVELGRKIFCKRDVLTNALVKVNAVNIVMRRLMQGVFIPSKITNCTVTGQPWRPGSKENPAQEKPKPLHQGALKAIVDFANGVAKKKKWKTLAFKDATSVLSGKLVEIKNQVKKGSLAD